MNKLILLALFVGLISCTTITKQQRLIGKWQYVSITQNNKEFLETTHKDYLLLNKNGSFKYELIKAKRAGEGTWTLEDNVLKLHYASSYTIRNFKIRILTEKVLEFDENNTVFKFTYVNME
jgi:hypothetical protein